MTHFHIKRPRIVKVIPGLSEYNWSHNPFVDPLELVKKKDKHRQQINEWNKKNR